MEARISRPYLEYYDHGKTALHFTLEQYDESNKECVCTKFLMCIIEFDDEKEEFVFIANGSEVARI